MEGLYKYLSNNKIVSLFIDRGNVTLDLLTNHLNTFTLQFKNKDLERHYYSFINEESVPYVTVGCVFVALLYFVYIPLDASFDHFIPLLISRVATGGVLLIALTMIVFTRFFRNHCVHLMTILLFGISVTAMLSLILRDDVGFAPLFMVLLFGNLHCSAFAWHRAISGLLQILAQALVWIFLLKKDTKNFLITQTLSYLLFFISAILASYMRELAHRRVYYIIHEMLNSQELKNYAVMLSSSANNLAHKRNTKRFSVAPRFSVELPLQPLPDPLVASPTSSTKGSDLGSSMEFTHANLASSSSDVSAPSIPASPTISASLFSSHAPSFSSSSDQLPPPKLPPPAMLNIQKSYFSVVDRLTEILSICIPPRGDAEMSEVGYHRAVYLYVRRLQHPITQRFRDSVREQKFQAWHVDDTVLSLRRFLLLNIISIACLTTHDVTGFGFKHSETQMLLFIRFCVIIPLIFLSLTTSMIKYVKRWRGTIITILEICCSVAALSMGLYAWYVLKPRMAKPVQAYDLYFGYVVRFVVYCFCGMGLLWMQSTFIAAAMLVVMFVATSILGVPLALSPLMIILIGFIISFYDERTRRTEFFLVTYRDEVLAYIHAKEQYESPMAVRAQVSLSNLADFS